MSRSKLKLDDISKADALQDIIEGIDFSTLTGSHPLDKAASFVKVLKAMGGLDEMSKQRGSNPKGFRRAIEDMANMLEKGMPGGQFAKEGDYADQDDSLPFEDQLEAMTEKQRMTLLAMARLEKLPSLAGFGAKTKLIEDPLGEIVVQTEIETISEAFDVDSEDLADEMFWEKAVALEFHKEVRYKKQTFKQAIALALDWSGSMNTDFKKGYMRAVLNLMGERLVKGDIILYIVKFTHVMLNNGYVKITTAEELREYIDKMKAPGGGYTEVGKVIVETQQMIRSGKLSDHDLEGVEPQLVIINDGQDVIHPVDTIAPIHAISLEQLNEQLKSLCYESDGTFALFSQR